MAEDKARGLTLYVQSKKVVTSFYRPPASRVIVGPSPDMPGGGAVDVRTAGSTEDESAGAGTEEFFLSDDQAHCLALTEEIAAKRGYSVEVVDVGRAGRLERIMVERLRGVQKFPVLVAPTGQRLEGTTAFTEEHLCELMPTDLPGRRAFTYLKVRGGDLDRIRTLLLGLPEVRELHLLTGDWDVFIVLEFPSSPSSKRLVLDFVTSRIRTIPEVLDTSTLVPEYSVTKFAT